MKRNLKIDWQVLEILQVIGNEGIGITFPLETEDNLFIYCHYYSRDNWYSEFHKKGCYHIEFVTTGIADMYFVVGYKKQL